MALKHLRILQIFIVKAISQFQQGDLLAVDRAPVTGRGRELPADTHATEPVCRSA